MTSQAKVSTIASVLLHMGIFFILAGVKIYSELTVDSNIGVAFVNMKDDKPLRRSNDVRPAISIKKTKQNTSQEQAIVRPRHNSRVTFYTNAPQVEFSAVRSVEQIGANRFGTMHRPTSRMKQQVAAPMEVSVVKPGSSFVQMDDRISSGIDLVRDAKPTYVRAEITNILQQFASIVRKRIESAKRYPLAAQRSGITGEVSVRLTILRNGTLEDVVVAEPSGYEILDKAAIGSVRRASPFPPIPEKSGKDKIHLTVQLLFNIT